MLLWARGVTPTSGVLVQCISRGTSSPVSATYSLSPERAAGPPRPTDPADAVTMSADQHGRGLGIVGRAVVAAMIVAAVSGSAARAEPSPLRDERRENEPQIRWSWPVHPPRIVQAYRAPAHAYGPGHRGIDLAAEVGAEVLAPDDGVVAFAGTVVDRPIVTIDHGGGLTSTLEPVAPRMPAGAVVRRGDPVGTVSTGGHTAPGALHLGARRDDVYLNPLQLLGEVPRAVLLPCCTRDQDPGYVLPDPETSVVPTRGAVRTLSLPAI